MTESDIWYYLDADYRKTPPKDTLYCCKCQKKVNLTSAFKIELSLDYTMFRINPEGTHLIGADCLKQVKKRQ